MRFIVKPDRKSSMPIKKVSIFIQYVPEIKEKQIIDYYCWQKFFFFKLNLSLFKKRHNDAIRGGPFNLEPKNLSLLHIIGAITNSGVIFHHGFLLRLFLSAIS